MSPIATASIEDSYELLPNYAAQRLTITMLDPPGATTTFPGKVIRVRVDGAPADTVGVFYPGGVVIAELEDFQDTNGRQITIPIDYAGRFEMIAIGEQGNEGRISTSLPYVLTVDPGAKSPPATVQEIRVEPSTIVLSGPGASTQVSVFAEYSDGVEREIAGAGLGTTFAPSGAYFNVTDDGVVVAKLPGSATFNVSNAGHVDPVPVTVLSGPAINNAPHADAGDSYEACDGQVVFLDGSGSYDLDENLGEALTFAWDLDADGQFDDATGPTPAVQLNFPGQYWILGLRVTDSQGAESTDYAILDAAPGCLDGEFVCARTRVGANNAHVGVDASGNIYVAEWNNTGLFGDRIVKFNSSCDSIATFDIATQPSALAVGADGTSYIPDTSADGVWKYTSSGLESFVYLGFNPYHAAVDANGNIYCADGNGNVRKHSSTGIAITSWAASEAVGAFGNSQWVRTRRSMSPRTIVLRAAFYRTEPTYWTGS